ncbi:N-acetylmuramoyl-L-alanine amidase [Trichloromonas sp.]|uniref:N-acetylmuramoyl-L-alanine amidase n=1 Tax=Trichloromonas sp. TaxID=3069249 RepID=UPI002A4119CC|nr:N-acetylmuramoyl-L-alanine amidase [Trichloromonas sp.]
MSKFKKLFKKTFIPNNNEIINNEPDNYVEINNDINDNIINEPDNYVEVISEPDNIKEIINESNWINLEPIKISKIKKVDFPTDQYYHIETSKNQITIHHTVSGEGVRGDINYWLSDSKRISTHFIIGHDGIPYQCYNSKYWGHHLSVKSTFLKNNGFDDYKSRNVLLNESSISIEIDSWGGLILGDGNSKKFGRKTIITEKDKYYNAYGNIVDVPVIHYTEGFRGYYYYEKYTDEQIRTLGELLLFFGKRYNIPLDYNDNIWDVNMDALSGKSGVYSHSSYREDKSDCHPQPELVDMLKTLKSL